MRRAAALVVAVALLGGPAFARDPAPDAKLSPVRLDPAVLDRAGRRALWKRNLGIGLTVPGMTMLTLGGVTSVYGAVDTNLFGGGTSIAVGAIVSGLGLAFALPGIVLWILAQDEMDVVTWRRKQLTSVSAGGSAFTLRF